MTRLDYLVQMWLVAKRRRAWMERTMQARGCACGTRPVAKCAYRDTDPELHDLLRDLVGLLNGHLPPVIGGAAA